MKYLVTLQEAEKVGIEKVGGKAFNLSRLKNAGFNVPDGYVLTTEAFEHFENNRLIPISNSELPTYELCAVRSSANIEDSEKLSFAGMFRTSIYTTRDKILNEVLNCYDSVEHPKVLAYMKEMKVKKPIKMAVLIQEMITPKASGIVFTKDAFNPDLLSIEAISGVCDKLTSGAITADIYHVERETGEIKEKRINFFKDRSVLNEGEIVTLFKTGLDIERFFGVPQDIEYALKNGKVFILQSRSITTLSE